jgi:predicted PurR-regulated permease PerM
VADQTREFDGRTRAGVPPSVTAMMAVLVAATVAAALYLACEVVVPITLAVLLSFLLAPGVRWLRRLRVGRVTAVALTVLFAFMAIGGFAAVVVGEVSSLAQQLPEYRYNLQTKIRSLPGVVPGSGVFRRATAMLRELGSELSAAEGQGAGRGNPYVSAAPEPAPPKPVPVQIREPEPGPLQIVQGVVGPLLQPLAAGGLVIVFVIMILLEREDLRDRLLRLAGRHDLHRTTEAMNDAAQRISRYLLSQLIVNISCGLPIGIGLTLIGIPNAALWGIMTVLLRFVPYLGIVISAAFPLALAIAVAPGWMLLVWTALLFIGIELVVANLVETAGLPRHDGVVIGGSYRCGYVLDMALGANRAAAVDTNDGVSGCAWSTRAAVAISRRTAWQRAGFDAARDLLPTYPCQRSGRGDGASRRIRQGPFVDGIF